jgi:hypothetical protein
MKGLISYPLTTCETIHSYKKHDIKQLLEYVSFITFFVTYFDVYF